MVKLYTHTYEVKEGKDTCKTEFIFELEEAEGKNIIKNLTIEGEKGCIGHNKSISILIQGQAIEDIPLEALAEAGCKRASSCSQELAEALQEILDKRQK
ncbi:MAG: TSCPD domain-containing protein [Candidatus Heimdallarchaeota archaeon]